MSTGEAPDPLTETMDTYLRGMDQDPSNANGTSPVSRTVSYPSNGPDAGSPAVTDSDWLAGQVLESDTYTQAGGAVDKAAITSWPSAWTQTATQPQTDTQPDPITGQPQTITMPALDASMPTAQATDTMDLTIAPGGTTTSWTRTRSRTITTPATSPSRPTTPRPGPLRHAPPPRTRVRQRTTR